MILGNQNQQVIAPAQPITPVQPVQTEQQQASDTFAKAVEFVRQQVVKVRPYVGNDGRPYANLKFKPTATLEHANPALLLTDLLAIAKANRLWIRYEFRERNEIIEGRAIKANAELNTATLARDLSMTPVSGKSSTEAVIVSTRSVITGSSTVSEEQPAPLVSFGKLI
jgi:hypothetical protein